MDELKARVHQLADEYHMPLQHVYWRADGRAAMLLVPGPVMDILFEVSLSADDEVVYVDSDVVRLEPIVE